MDPKDQRKEMLPDDGLDEDLQSIRERLSTLGEQEPPALLDQAVLNTARRELAGRKRRPMRWIGAFATASVLVLTLTLVIQQQQAPVPEETGQSKGARLDRTSESSTGSREQGQAEHSVDSDHAGMEMRAKEDARQRSAQPIQVAPAKRKAEEELELDNEPAAAPAPPPAAPRSEFSADFRDGNEDTLDEVSDAEEPAELHKQAVTAEAAQDELKSVVESPAEWVARMLELKQNEQFEQLQRELDAFEAAYPEYPLPPELAAFAE